MLTELGHALPCDGEDGENGLWAGEDRPVTDLHRRVGSEEVHDLIETSAVPVGVVTGDEIADALTCFELPHIHRCLPPLGSLPGVFRAPIGWRVSKAEASSGGALFV